MDLTTIGLGNARGMISSPIAGSLFPLYFERDSSMQAHHSETNLFMSIVVMPGSAAISVRSKDTHSHMRNGH